MAEGEGSESVGAGSERRVAEDDLVSTKHSVATEHGELSYAVTAGRMVLREDVISDGTFTERKPKADVFVTAYVAEGGQPGSRPVTFAFNGGPGSSSVWLHMGLLGPRRGGRRRRRAGATAVRARG
jgi:carboxypeptidase C (cathepsin A)